MQNFVYLIGDPETRECVVVDPAWEIDAIVDQVERDGMKLRGALVTHTHQDHVGGHLFGFDIPGVEELLARVPVKVYVHKAEREFLRGFGSDLVKVDGGDTVSVGRLTVSFIHTPGHTPGSHAPIDGPLVSGDTYSSVVRTQRSPAGSRRDVNSPTSGWGARPGRDVCSRATITAAPQPQA